MVAFCQLFSIHEDLENGGGQDRDPAWREVFVVYPYMTLMEGDHN